MLSARSSSHSRILGALRTIGLVVLALLMLVPGSGCGLSTEGFADDDIDADVGDDADDVEIEQDLTETDDAEPSDDAETDDADTDDVTDDVTDTDDGETVDSEEPESDDGEADTDDVEIESDIDVDSDVADDVPPPPRCPDGMVYVAAGPFLMGNPEEIGFYDTHPQHVVTLSAYCIDVTEVTSLAYNEWLGYPGGDLRPASAEWAAADLYCTERDARLPTEAQWEKAARGGCEIVAPSTCGPEDGRTYPWGETLPSVDCTLAATNWCDDTTFTVVGAHPAGASPYGALDMSGNAWEWIHDWSNYTYYETCAAGCTDPRGPFSPSLMGDYRVQRGGNYNDAEIAMTVTFRAHRLGTDVTYEPGFRCAADPIW